MIKKETIELKSISAVHEGDYVQYEVIVHNPVNRTLYIYGTPRRILYNNASKMLTLSFHDLFIDENSLIAMHIKRPIFVEIPGKTTTEFSFKLPKIIRRIKRANEGGGVELLPIDEAANVDLEIAQNDTPFYYNPKINNAVQLKEWGKFTSKVLMPIKPVSTTEKPHSKKNKDEDRHKKENL